MLPSETMIWQPEFTDKTLSRKPGAVQWWCFSCLVLLKIFSDIYYLRESFTPHLSIHSLEI
ncbi:hypothetical protein GUK05_25000 [Escherichia coli]|nr:hypothetical protein [Escherichia coli]